LEEIKPQWKCLHFLNVLFLHLKKNTKHQNNFYYSNYRSIFKIVCKQKECIFDWCHFTWKIINTTNKYQTLLCNSNIVGDLPFKNNNLFATISKQILLLLLENFIFFFSLIKDRFSSINSSSSRIFFLILFLFCFKSLFGGNKTAMEMPSLSKCFVSSSQKKYKTPK